MLDLPEELEPQKQRLLSYKLSPNGSKALVLSGEKKTHLDGN